MDGQTRITLGSVADVTLSGDPIFDGILMTPTSAVLVSTCEHETILETVVQSRETRVRIWTNRTQEPDEITIVLGS